MPSPQANDTPWWFHPGSYILLCFTPKRNHSIMTQCSVRGILAFRRGVDYFSILQTKFSYGERHKARRVGLETMPLDQHIEERHREREPCLKIRPLAVQDFL